MPTSNKKIIIFGAGKIGRSFIAQLFSQTGYSVVFIDIDKEIIDALNQRGTYDVVIKSVKDIVIKVDNVSGVLASDEKQVIDAIVNCSIMATCVGKNAFPRVIPLIAKGFETRYAEKPCSPVDIILAENIRGASNHMYRSLKKLLQEGFPVDSYIGLVETSIGKMVPIMPKEIEQADPLLVYAEAYNTLIVGKTGFKNSIPDVHGLSAKGDIKAWVDRKLFMHNLGHVAAAYFGFYMYPEKKYLYEVLEKKDVLAFTTKVMEQSAKVLVKEYPCEFTMEDLRLHIVDLISRFRNKALGDTIYRVGMDLKRKLGKNDRIVGAIRLAQKHHCRFDKILEILLYGFFFRASNEFNLMYPNDIELIGKMGKNIDDILIKICGFDLQKDRSIFIEINSNYNRMKFGRHQ